MAQSSKTPPLALKLIMIGDSACGKSALLHRFIEGKFSEENQKQTVGVEFGSKTWKLGDRTIKLQIWDTSGQERFRSVTHSYYRGAVGALVVYDIANRASFENVRNWIKDVRALAGPHVTIILCGNKTDLSEDERQTSLLEGSRFAQENDCLFLETSAVSGANVEEIFFKCAKTIVNKIDMGAIQLSPGMNGTLKPRMVTKDTKTDDRKNDGQACCGT